MEQMRPVNRFCRMAGPLAGARLGGYARGMAVDTRFAVYGTLAPGRPNHHQLAGIDGRWCDGTVRGRLVAKGWGAQQGYPALILDPAGDPIAVQLFTAPDLPAHWPRLDAFEGEEYRRVVAEVTVGDAVVGAWIYVWGGE